MPLEKPDVYNALCVYRELGLKFARLEKYEKSLYYFDNALERDPQDIRALMGRSVCRAQSCKYNEALKDIRTLLEKDPDNIYVSTTECLVKYLSCKFEDAMVRNLSRSVQRKKPENFVLGAMHCEDAIQNNVGSRAGHPLRDHFQIVRKMAWKNVINTKTQLQPKPRYKKKRKEPLDEGIHTLAAPKAKLPPPVEQTRRREARRSVASIASKGRMDSDTKELLSEGSSIRESLNSYKDSGHLVPKLENYPFKPIQRYTTNIQNLMAERYLDTMYYDKTFLRNLKSNIGVKSPNEAGVQKIRSLAKKSFKYIQYNQELLRARRPFYLLRLQDGKAGGKLKERQLEREKAMTKYCEGEAQSMTNRIKNAVSQNNLRQIIEMSEKMLKFCENNTKKTLPNRDSFLQQLYDLVRDGFYMIKRLKPNMTPEQKHTRLVVLLGLPKQKGGSTDSLITQFKDYFMDTKKLCKVFEARVRNSTKRNELVWFYHELSRLNFDRKEYELAKAYGTKCLRESYFIKDERWMVNASFLLVKVHVGMRNKNGAKIGLKGCRKIAKRIEDHDLDEFLEECIYAVSRSEMDATQPSKMLENRTNNIMKLMTTESMKMEATLIFQRIKALPPSKRMSVLPGIVHPSTTSMKANATEVKNDEISLASNVKSVDRRDDRRVSRGINFLELVKTDDRR